MHTFVDTVMPFLLLLGLLYIIIQDSFEDFCMEKWDKLKSWFKKK